ncbi:MAG: GTP 3',8-cyclase MoaA [Spirochaetales bacterium]|nr:GTP 3',8-cyclase MoaA [Spirochaetales bacterium]
MRKIRDSRYPSETKSANENSTLTDRLGRGMHDLRISVTDVCSFRCSYCMPDDLYGGGNPFLSQESLLRFDEIEAVARVAVLLGVRKFKITGGEPLLRPELHKLIRLLKSIPKVKDIGIITNGFHLIPQLKYLRDSGLTRITVSLDSLQPEVFERITGRSEALPAVLEGIRAAQSAGFSPLKVNMVIQRGLNSGEVLEMAAYFRGSGIVLRFIEYMDVGYRHRFNRGLLVPNAEIRDIIQSQWPLEQVVPGYYGEVAARYRYIDGSGEIGFISSMTQPFCRDCTRLRLSADGKLYRCLFSSLALDMKTLLRDSDGSTNINNAGIEASMRRFWGLRDDRYSELRSTGADGDADKQIITQKEPDEKKIEMYRMGG